MVALDNTLGALFIGLIISAVLHGATLSQTWFYFNSQSRDKADPPWLKSMVIVVALLDFVHQLFTSHWLYLFCVTHFGDLDALNFLPWSYYGMAYPTGLVTIIVQTFYVWRVWRLSESYIIAGGIWSLSLAQFVYVARVFHEPSAAQLSKDLGPYAILVNAIGAACDIAIAIAMVYYLRQARTSIKRTNHLLHSITIFSVTTGIISSVCAIMVLSMAGAYPGTNIELTFYFMLTRLYANSFLATLNVRDRFRESSYPTSGIITTSNFIQPRHQNISEVHRTVSSHELDDFPSPKGPRNYARDDLEIDDNISGTVISVKVDRTTDTVADYK